jgi:predicted RND superfamily exporter protein
MLLGERGRVCTKLQTGEMSHENQQNELYCNSEYLVLAVASTVVITFLIIHFYRLFECHS